MKDPVRELQIKEIERVEMALRVTASARLKRDYTKYLKRLKKDLRDYDRAIKRLEI